MDCGTQELDIVSDTGVLRKKSLFYGRVESYFAVYDSVVLTGPTRRRLPHSSPILRTRRQGKEKGGAVIVVGDGP